MVDVLLPPPLRHCRSRFLVRFLVLDLRRHSPLQLRDHYVCGSSNRSDFLPWSGWDAMTTKIARGVRMRWNKTGAIHATALRAGWSVVNDSVTGAVILRTMPLTPRHPHIASKILTFLMFYRYAFTTMTKKEVRGVLSHLLFGCHFFPCLSK